MIWLLMLGLLLVGCSAPTYDSAGPVIEADPATGATAGWSPATGGSAGAEPVTTGGTNSAGSPPTGGAEAAGGEELTGGESTGGAPPAGGSETGGSETGGSPSCSWQQAVNGLPGTFVWQDWSARNEFDGLCAQCVSSPCGTAELDPLDINNEGVTVSLQFETPPELEGGHCGGLADHCSLTGTNADYAVIHLQWEIEPTAGGWQATPIEADSWTNPQCYVQPGLDLEPWSRASLLDDLVSEFSAFIETVEWECP